ncbi:MAG: redoxin family protein, partial [Alphaproteobacteria bacterium]|nr:redoxin family protein [Alphaproteobacteria bacterium]
MKSRWLSTVPLFLLLALAVYFAFGLTQDPRTIHSVLIDKPLPAFDLPVFGQDGARITNEDFKGHVSLLNVFASWCVSCRAEHPLFVRLNDEKKVAIYGLAWKDKPDDLKQWLEELGNPYTRIADD